MASLFGGSPSEGDRIESGPLKFTTGAGITGVLVALAGAIPAVLEVLDALDLNDTQLVGVLALMGAGAVAFAIASAGDALARAYANAWVKPRTGDEPAQPVLELFVDAYRNAGGQARASAAGTMIPASEDLVVETVDGGNFRVLALQVGADAATLRYLIAAPGGQARWADSSDVRLVRVTSS